MESNISENVPEYPIALCEIGRYADAIPFFEEAMKKKRLTRGEKTYLLYLECLRKTGRDEDAQRLAKGLRSWDDVEEEPPYRGYYRPLPDELVDKLETLYSLERTILGRYHLDNAYPIYSIEDMSKIVGESPTFCQHLEEEALKRIGLTQEYFVALKSELDQNMQLRFLFPIESVYSTEVPQRRFDDVTPF